MFASTGQLAVVFSLARLYHLAITERKPLALSRTQSSTQPPCALTLPHSFSFFLLFLLHAGFSKSGQGGVIAAASRAEIPRDETCRNTLVIPPQQATPCGEHTPAPLGVSSRGKRAKREKALCGKEKSAQVRQARLAWPGCRRSCGLI